MAPRPADHDPVTRLADEIRRRLPSSAPVVVAIDGRSGAGKSTLAAAVAAEVGAVVIDGDDFYAGGTAATWDRRTAAEKAAGCIDWRRQRAVLEAVRAGARATWRPYDWDAFDGRLADEVAPLPPAPVVLLEGAYSARPELADLVDLRVLLDTPAAVRHRRLLAREGDGYLDDWAARWTEAEDHYFGTVAPPSAFDLVLPWDPADERDRPARAAPGADQAGPIRRG